MRRRTAILIGIALLVAAAAIYAYREYSRKPVDIASASPDLQLNSAEVIAQLQKNDSASFRKMEGKILQITGNIKEVSGSDKNWLILLGEEGGMESVRCSMDSSANIGGAGLRVGEPVTIKGTCSGVDADELLGTDLLLNRCVIVKNEK